MLRAAAAALAAAALLAALPAAAGDLAEAGFAWRIAAEDLPAARFALAVDGRGALLAGLRTGPGPEHLPPVGEPAPGALPALREVDACLTEGAALGRTCDGQVGAAIGAHPLPPSAFGLAGAAASLEVPGSAETSIVFTNGKVRTFRCTWTPSGAVAGAVVVEGSCALTALGTGTAWTLRGAQGAGNAGALEHHALRP